MKLAIILMLLFAALTLAGALIIQAPAGVSTIRTHGPSGWPTLRPRFGDLTDVIDRLELFTVFPSVWLRALGGLLTTSLIACSVQRFPGPWRTIGSRTSDVGPSFFERRRPAPSRR